MSLASRLASIFLPNNQTPHFVPDELSALSTPHGGADARNPHQAAGARAENITNMEEETEARYPLRNVSSLHPPAPY